MTTQDEIKQALDEADPQDLEAIRWYVLYKMSQEERENAIAMLKRSVESRQDGTTVEYLKRVPLALEGLPPSRLMDFVEVALSDVHDWIVENCPQARAKLEAYDTLNIYYLTPGEKSERDMRDVITAICTAWDVTLFPVSVETKPTATR